MKKKNQIWGCVTILSIIVITLLIDYLTNSCFLRWESLILILGFCLLVISVIINKDFIFRKKEQKGEKDNSKMNFQKKILLLIRNSFSGNILDIAFIFYFILCTEWIPNAFIDLAKGEQNIFIPFVYIAGLLSAIWLKPFYDEEHSMVDCTKRRVLVTGISDVKYGYSKPKREMTTNLSLVLKPFEKYQKIEKVLILLSSRLLWGIKTNIFIYEEDESKKGFKEEEKLIYQEAATKDKLYPHFKAYKETIIESCKKVIEKIIEESMLILAKTNDDDVFREIIIKKVSETFKGIDIKNAEKIAKIINRKKISESVENVVSQFTNIIVEKISNSIITDALSNLIINCINTQYNHNFDSETIKFHFTAPVDYNEFEQCEKELYLSVYYLQKKENYTDEQILVNISPGTSIVSGVMTLNAIKGNRGLIYTRQDNTALVEYNPDVMVLQDYIYDFSDELVKRNENKT